MFVCRIYILVFLHMLCLSQSNKALHDESGVPINLTSLITQFSLVCPIQQFCQPGSSSLVGFNATGERVELVPRDCVPCSCDTFCREEGTCCPDNLKAYEQLDCVDVTVVSRRYATLWYLLKASCPHDADPETREKCQTFDINPIYSKESRLNYFNEFCAKCNHQHNHRLVKWPLAMRCRELSPDSLESIGRTCVFHFIPPKTAYARHCMPWDPSQYPPIDRCNVTGLWPKFDNDIDFGCRRFNKLYGNFKNVFCFICNPSESSIKMTQYPPVNRCTTGDTRRFETLAELCLKMGTSERLAPFKNVYCKLCATEFFVHKNKTARIYIDTVSKLGDEQAALFEITIPAKTSNVHSTLTLIAMQLENTQRHVAEGLFEAPKRPTSTRPETDKASPELIPSLIRQYASLCGQTNVCDLSYIDYQPNVTLPVYRVCPRCDCSDNCVISDFPCCLDKLLLDMPYQCRRQSTFLSVSFSNPNQRNVGDTFFNVVSKCPKRTDSSESVNCMNDAVDGTNILKQVPVILKESMTSFKNIYCFECYKGLKKDLLVYFSVRCNGYFEGFMFQSFEEIVEAAREFKCNIAFRLPDDMECRPYGPEPVEGMISRCNVTGRWRKEHSAVKEACEDTDFYGLLDRNFSPYPLHLYTYKNPLCALCNEEMATLAAEDERIYAQCADEAHDTVKELCHNMPREGWWTAYRNVYCYTCATNTAEYNETERIYEAYFRNTYSVPVLSYRSLFSINRQDIETLVVELQKPCRNGSFDHQKTKCVELYCSGVRILRDGKCVHVIDSLSDSRYHLEVNLKLVHKVGNFKFENITQMEPEVDRTERELVINSNTVCTSILTDLAERLKSHGERSSVPYQCSVHARPCRSNTTRDTVGEDITMILPLDQQVILSLQLSFILRRTHNRTVFEDDLIETTYKEFTIGYYKWVPHPVGVGPVGIWPCVHNIAGADQNVTVRSVTLKRTSNCPMVELLRDDTMDIDTATGDLVMYGGKSRIGPGNYLSTIRLNRNYVRICQQAVTGGTENKSLKLAQQPSLIHLSYMIFSSCCSALSMLGLYITFMTYCLFKELRTVPGINNMHLSMCLFLAQGGLLYSANLTDRLGSLICQITGIVIHYFWLATFCAMNVCSFHVYQVFVAKSISSQSTPNQKFKRAIQYAIYIYSIPLASILTVVLVNLTQSHVTDIGYGVSICFIDGLLSLVFGFLVPTGIITLLNIVFYCLTFHRLCMSPTLRRTSYQDRQELVIYVKLCSITGVMWPLVFVDAFFPLSVFSFLVTFVNGLQGVFMFLSFVCNRRVCTMYRSLVKWGFKVELSTGSAHSSSRMTNNSTKRYTMEKSTTLPPHADSRPYQPELQ